MTGPVRAKRIPRPPLGERCLVIPDGPGLRAPDHGEDQNFTGIGSGGCVIRFGRLTWSPKRRTEQCGWLRSKTTGSRTQRFPNWQSWLTLLGARCMTRWPLLFPPACKPTIRLNGSLLGNFALVQHCALCCTWSSQQRGLSCFLGAG